MLGVIFLLSLFGCNPDRQIKFDKGKWNDQIDPLFPSSYRSRMIDDLITNYKLIGLKYSRLIELLGVPDMKDDTSLSYKIVVDYGHGVDPVYAKNLDFSFSKDSVIISFKIDEWKK
jgi:hypothetical protein